MTQYLVKLTFKSPVHFGTKEKMYEVSEPTASSITLFSAMCNAYRFLYGRESLERLLNGYIIGEEPFLISSTFPFHDETLYLPKPSSLDLSKLVGDYKKAKKVKYVPFEALTGQRKITDFQVIKQGFLMDKEVEYVFQSREVPRVVLDEMTHASSLYHVQVYFFAQTAGLYFFLNLNDESLLSKITGVINFLGDEGLGGERTYGYGLFSASMEENNKIAPEAGNYLLLSSLFTGSDELGNLKPVSYNLRNIGGYVYSMGGRPYRRKSVLMFTEGSVFKTKLQGRLVEVTPAGFPDHKVYCYGLAYCLPVNL